MSQYHYRHPYQAERAHTNAYMGPGGPAPPQYPTLPVYSQPPGQGQNILPATPVQQTPAPSTGGGLFGAGSKLNFNDVKTIIDRMGGIDGIMNSINKMSSIIQNVQKMAPMIKLLAGSLIPAKATTTDIDLKTPRAKKRRRKRTSSHQRRYAANSKKRRSAAGRSSAGSSAAGRNRKRS